MQSSKLSKPSPQKRADQARGTTKLLSLVALPWSEASRAIEAQDAYRASAR
jgi:hypothetical protein